MANSTSPSRRTVVKGAAWATPALVVASAVPAIAASPDDDLCKVTADELGWFTQKADWIQWTRVVGRDDSTVPGKKGSFFDTRLGTWQFNLAGTKFENQRITGYRINWDTGKDIVFRSIDIDKWNGKPESLVEGPKDTADKGEWTGRFSIKPNSGPLAKGAGLVYTASIQSTMPYNERESLLKPYPCGKSGFAKAFVVSIPFSPVFLRVLTPNPEQPEVTCDTVYYWNAVLESVGNLCGSYKNAEQLNWISAGVPEVKPAS